MERSTDLHARGDARQGGSVEPTSSVTGVLLNAFSLRPGGSGVQTYGRELVRQLGPRLGGRMNARLQADALDEVPGSVTTIARPPSDGVRRLVDSLFPVRAAERAGLGTGAVVHSLDVDLPLFADLPTVTTVHDLSVFDVPWAHGSVRARGEQLVVARCIRRADEVIAVSQFTADAVAERFGRQATVTRLAPSPDMETPKDEAIEDVIERFGLPDHFVLHVGTVEPRKDVPRLAEVCAELGVPLVLAGRVEIDGALAGDVRRLGYVERSLLPALYRAATVVAYPSVYEGFGLPPIEAMACGANVVATAVGALPELADLAEPGEARFELCAPGDSGQLRDAIAAALDDQGHVAAQRWAAELLVGRLSWTDTATRTLEVYEAAVAGHDPGRRRRPWARGSA